MLSRASNKKAERQAELQRRRDAFQLKLRHDDFEIHGYRCNHGSGGYAVADNSDMSITVGDALFGTVVTMEFPDAVARIERRPRKAPLSAFGVVGPRPVAKRYYLTMRSVGAEAIFPIDGMNLPYLKSFVAPKAIIEDARPRLL